MPTLAKPETQPGTVLGTVGYMSPEQASGQPVDFRSDQFSLGSILYEMAPGQKAFQRNTAAETMSAIIRDEPEPLGKLRPELAAASAMDHRALPGQGPGGALRLDTRPRAGPRERARPHLRGLERGGGHRCRAGPQDEALSSRSSRGRPFSSLGIVAGGGSSRAACSAKASASSPRFHRLTFRRGLIHNARFAPDGQTSSTEPHGTGETQRLYADAARQSRVVGAGLSEAETGTSSPCPPPASLPSSPFRRQVLARVPMAGGVPRDVVQGVPYASADWAPNGKDLAVVHEVNHRLRLEFPIGKVLLETHGANLVARGSRRAETGSPSSPRSEQRRRSASSKRSGKGSRELSGGWADISGVPCWSPDGREIWFIAGASGRGARRFTPLTCRGSCGW